jgi:hypothetical protein
MITKEKKKDTWIGDDVLYTGSDLGLHAIFVFLQIGIT